MPSGDLPASAPPAAPTSPPPFEAPNPLEGIQVSHRRLGDVIVELGFAERGVVEATVALAREDGRPIGQALVQSGIISTSQLAQALADRNGLDFVDLNRFEVDHGAVNLISNIEARRNRAIPIAFEGEALIVATADPANVLGLDNIGVLTDRQIRPIVASPDDIDALISQVSSLIDSVHEVEEAREEDLNDPNNVDLQASADDEPVVKLLNSILADAVTRGASDIHLDPRGADMRVRYRIDGVVSDSATVPSRMTAGLISRLKIMADMNIAERRAPQDGRIGLTIDGRFVDIRVATLPVMRGESAIMRILDKGKMVSDLRKLGMRLQDRELLERSVSRTHGAVLVTGPTGSGKTTTLYATLSSINSPDKTLIAIEDPVEYELEDIKQVQVNPKVGLSFAAGLRSIVRADPDVIMVGEIRDRETAQIAVESALTGHLVLSTLHTSDAPTAAARLTEMGIEPFLIASGVQCVVAQRLARKLCEDCRQPAQVPGAELRASGFDAQEEMVDVHEPNGCVHCNGSGYRGRIGLYEVMEVTEEISALILNRASATDIANAAVAGGMRRIREDGLEKARMGVTSMAEIIRVLGT